MGRIIISLDPDMLATLHGPKLEDFFRSIVTLLGERFSVELRLVRED